MDMFVASLLAAVGYLLIYAAAGDGGRYATRPWQGLSA